MLGRTMCLAIGTLVILFSMAPPVAVAEPGARCADPVDAECFYCVYDRGSEHEYCGQDYEGRFCHLWVDGSCIAVASP